MLIRIQHWTLSWARWFHFTLSYSILFQIHIVLSSLLILKWLKWLVPFRFSNWKDYTNFLFLPRTLHVPPIVLVTNYPDWNFSWFFSVSPGKFLNDSINKAMVPSSHILFHPLFSNQPTFRLWRNYNLRSWKMSSNKIYNNKIKYPAHIISIYLIILIIFDLKWPT